MTHDVLVIDDSATVRKLVEISLRGRPLRPHFAETGGEGIRCATELVPSAILLDFMLPDMTGVEVCRALAADARTRAIPILVVTAKHERMRSEFVPYPSVVDFLGKPFNGPDLIARIDRAIAARSGAYGAPPAPAAPPAAPTAHTVHTATTVAIPTLANAPLPPAARPPRPPSAGTGRIAAPVSATARPADPRRDSGGARRDSGGARRDPVERAAKLLFARLRDGLALLPSQLRSLEPGPIAPQLARRLLTPQVVEGILSDLRPLYAELTDTEPRRAEPAASTRPRPVVICEPDVDAFEQPLRTLLARRTTARELIAVGRVDEVVAVARQQKPCLVMINATSRIADACTTAVALRAELALSDLAMIAVVEARVRRAPDLLAAGFDAVLAKPVIVAELERFLTPADLR